jgi:hypothetical protein
MKRLGLVKAELSPNRPIFIHSIRPSGHGSAAAYQSSVLVAGKRRLNVQSRDIVF